MTDERRHDPDHLLALAKSAEAQEARGELRVYLGMCPGVGKTYTMLEDARQLARAGNSVLVALVEPHGRADTEALLADLELLPRRTVEYRGTVLRELDLDAVLGRKADVVLVDELPHTNAPGSRHPKRWQDIRELVESGLDVWTTVNIQHVESLRDAVARITGIRVQETIPDSFFDLADEIRLIDLPPDQLRQRLREGKVYLGDRAAAAAEGFFREGNLSALREMALRFTAQRVDREMRDYMRRHLIVGPWRSGERLLVAVGSSPFSERLIRLTRRLAGSLHGSWLAVHVETGEVFDDDTRARLAANLALARSLGAEVVSVSGEHTASTLLAVARRENVSQIVAGKPLGLAWWKRIFGLSIADRLARDSGDIDLVLVHPSEGDDDMRSQAGSSIRRGALRQRPRDWGLAAALLVGTTVAGLLAESWIGYRSVPMLYLLSVCLAGLFLHRWAVLGLAVASTLAWNFFFTHPRLTFAMFDREDLFILIAFLTVASILGHLTTRLLRREHASREGEERAQALYQLTRVLAASVDFSQAVRQALRQVAEVFNADVTLLLPGAAGELELLAGSDLDARDLSVCEWVASRQRAAGRFTDTLPEASVLALPLPGAEAGLGVLALRPRDDRLLSPLRRDLLDAFAAHLTVLVEKESLVRASREARVTAASQQLQRALLDQVSHELKTPAAVINAAVARLAGSATTDPQMVEEIKEATARLNRVVTQLVTLSRVEAGMVSPNVEVCDARDLFEEIAAELGKDASRVEIMGDNLEFRADSSLMHTALGNLLVNAVQHSPAGTPVRVSVARDDQGGVRFDVSSAGNPIPATEQAGLFDRFVRGTNARPGGMGLGLSIARHFVEAMGGKLDLVASDQRETIFRVTLPRDLVLSPAIEPR